MNNILLVEDDTLLIDIYSTKLKEAGYEVNVVSDGEKVLESVKKHKPALVLLDIVLPELDGWGVLKAIKEDSATKDTKVLVLSNLGQKEEVDKGIKLGAVQYLVKAHHTPSQVVSEVAALLKK
jgi:DNA-binding response OmpR family regulator